MYKLHIDGREIWDEDNELFYKIEPKDLVLEHSLVSISKWEAKYKKSYIDTENKTLEELLDYFSMMVIGDDVDPNAFLFLSEAQIEGLTKYINDPMTATVFSKWEEDEFTKKNNHSSKFTTSEEIYYWMTSQNIPIECQYWHLNRLITLVKICAIKNKPEDKKKKRMTFDELTKRRAQMEAARKKYGGH